MVVKIVVKIGDISSASASSVSILGIFDCFAFSIFLLVSVFFNSDGAVVHGNSHEEEMKKVSQELQFPGDDMAVTVRFFCFAKVGLGFAGGASMGGDMGGLYRGDHPHPLLDISFIVVK